MKQGKINNGSSNNLVNTLSIIICQTQFHMQIFIIYVVIFCWLLIPTKILLVSVHIYVRVCIRVPTDY